MYAIRSYYDRNRRNFNSPQELGSLNRRRPKRRMEPQRLKDKDKEAPPDQGTTNEDSDNQQDGPIPLPWIEAESPHKSQDEATSTPLSPEEGTDAVHSYNFV